MSSIVGGADSEWRDCSSFSLMAGVLAGELKLFTSTSMTAGIWLMIDYFLVAKIFLIINFA
jgi:hypothetical protein